MSDQQSGFHFLIRQGDSTTSVAFANGFFWETLWNHGENSSLKELRKKPNILLPGDRLYVPELRKKQVEKACEQKHTFKRKGVPEKLKMRFLDHESKPYADQPYTITIDGSERKGTLDGDGYFDEWIPPGARKAVILVGEEGALFAQTLNIGNLDPIQEVVGVEKRLINLGYLAPPVTGTETDELQAAVAKFRADNGLPEGGIDSELREKLEEVHKS